MIGVTASSLQGDSCSWLLRYEFHQLDKNLTSLTKLSALIVDLGTTQQGTWSHLSSPPKAISKASPLSGPDVVHQYSCWAGCVSDPTYDASSTTSLSYPWRFNFSKNSCACMRGDYTFDIALTGVSLVWGQVGVVSALGESMTCPAIAFAPCSESTEGIDMSSTPTDTPSAFFSVPLITLPLLVTRRLSVGESAGEDRPVHRRLHHLGTFSHCV